MALRGVAMAAVITPAMSTKKHEVIFGGRIMGAKIRAEHTRELAKKAQRDADRAEAELRKPGGGIGQFDNPTKELPAMGWNAVQASRGAI